MPLVFYSIAFILFVLSFRINKAGNFLEKNSSNVIKGLFILLIVFSHILNTFPYNGFLASPLSFFRLILGQLIVSMFFFISGYGIIYSVKKDGNSYAKSIVTNRFIRILLYTTVSLIPFFIYSACLGKEHSVQDYYLAFIGLSSFGNSAWFLFAILVCYFACSIVFLFNYKRIIVPTALIGLSIIAYILIMFFIGKPNYTWNTIICFPFGMFACLFNEKINSFLSKKKPIPYILMAVSVVAVFGLQYAANSKFATYFPEMAVMWFVNLFFCLFFVSLTKVFTLKSPVLDYLGKASFAIFFMHRIIICIFDDFGTIPYEWLNYFVLFLSAVIIGIPFYYIYKLMDKVIINPIVKWNRGLISE